MPDNSVDYEDEDEDEDSLLQDFDDTDDDSVGVWNLLVLINPGDRDAVFSQFNAWRDRVADLDLGSDCVQAWLWALKDVIDWRSGFYTEGKDIKSFVDAVDELVARWNLRIDWGGDLDDDDFFTVTDVPQLMALAYDCLREHGYTLWNWDTDGNSYAGWIALSRDDEAMLTLCSMLDLEVRYGNEPF
ncbi:DUF6630 family protein [Xylella fastidiosa subsp. sandyi]|uniref:DUF6630 family protein n=1 Tax=Xylella fastidiosa TaxID=2371 RepID=UPI0007084729|nr:hypothetical protein [Xylella fastidiosa]KQH74422.1 hypothetical protein AOT81_02530 [Xylella fastidiosa]RWA45178.1 hypothetical protein XfCFBP8356_02745 [Xylella fastidiosa subsp. sandyi]WNY19886.1 hypothetical protein RO839_04545 [Xylella fastidiosa]WNY22180.1 hypothetical protein RO838_04555 [Xylella fastidiosa]